MLDFIYTLFIAPLEFWMGKSLQWGFDHTQSWGWAIIVMSLVVNTIILPIYLKAEHWQEEERSIRKSFENDEAMIKRTFKGQERFAMITTMHRHAGYSPLLTLRSSIGFLLQIPFFFAAYHLLSHFEPLQGVSFLGLTDLSKPDELFTIGGFAINVMPILMTVINIGSALIYTQNLSKRDKYQLYGMAAIFLVLLYNAASGLVLYWTFNNIYSLVKNIVIEKTSRLNFAFALPKVSFNWIPLKRLHFTPNQRKGYNWSSLQELFWPATFLWLGLTFIYFPVKLYASDPIAFSVPMDEVLSSLIGGCQLIIFAVFLIWFICRGYLRTSLSFLILILLISSILLAFVFEQDLGAMDAFRFQNEEVLKGQRNKLIDVSVFSLSLIASIVIVKINLIKSTRNFLSLILVIVLSVSLFYASPYLLSDVKKVSDPSADDILPYEVEEMFLFSKDKQNVIVLMLDAFTGGNMKQILLKDPDLHKSLDGFVWYPDTVSSGDMTLAGLPSILGGETLAAYNLARSSRNESLETTINKTWASFFNKLSSQNFNVSVHEYTWLDTKLISEYLDYPVNFIQSNTLWNKFPNLWNKNRQLVLNNKSVKNPRFFMWYGLFKISPLTLSETIYSNGKWRNSIKESYTLDVTIDRWSQLDSFSQISKVTNSSSMQFKYLFSEVTHMPWGMNESCIPDFKGGYRNKKFQNKDGTYDSHIQAELCSLYALIRWCDWMKKNGVYDNTMIVAVSDHGNDDSQQLHRLWDGKVENLNLHSLLLVKPFNSHGELEINKDALMTNFDVQQLIFNALNKKSNQPWLNKNRRRCSLVTNSWIRSKHSKNHFLTKELICINGPMLKKENWTKLEFN